jgi:hypothetical protein
MGYNLRASFWLHITDDFKRMRTLWLSGRLLLQSEASGMLRRTVCLILKTEAGSNPKE